MDDQRKPDPVDPWNHPSYDNRAGDCWAEDNKDQACWGETEHIECVYYRDMSGYDHYCVYGCHGHAYSYENYKDYEPPPEETSDQADHKDTRQGDPGV